MTRDEVLKLAGKSRAFCMAPWVHLYVPASGPVTACCEAKGDLGTIEGSGFEGVWNGEAMGAFRAGLMADQPNPWCWKCYENEERGSLSYRQRFNAEYARHADRVAKTEADGRLEGAPPVSWDLRFSNLCNLRCRMCWHGSSSRWFEDAKALGQTVLGTPADARQQQRFRELTAQLDSLRGENFQAVFPELAPLFTPTPSSPPSSPAE